LGIGQKGTALVRVSVGANGMPQNATIVKISNPQLVAAALETAVSSSYSPAMRNGRPVSGTYLATFGFDGEDPAVSSIPVWDRTPTPGPSATPMR
jgi:outer membrane biosynthesis protein TonB